MQQCAVKCRTNTLLSEVDNRTSYLPQQTITSPLDPYVGQSMVSLFTIKRAIGGKAIGYDCCLIVRLSPDATVRWHYRPNPIHNGTRRHHTGYIHCNSELDMGQFFEPKPNPTQNFRTQPNPWKWLPDPTEPIIDTLQLKQELSSS